METFRRASIETQNAVPYCEVLLWSDTISGILQFVQPLAGHRKTDQAAAVRRHEVDRFGRDFFGGDHQVAFVLAILIVDDDDDSAFLDLRDGFFNRCELHRA